MPSASFTFVAAITTSCTCVYTHTHTHTHTRSLFPFQLSTTSSWKPFWISPTQVLPLFPGSDASHWLC